jgi:hypothetical protein
MKNTKEYLIPFIGLKLKHHFEYSEISNAFFEIFDYNEYQNSNIKNVVLEEKYKFRVDEAAQQNVITDNFFITGR